MMLFTLYMMLFTLYMYVYVVVVVVCVNIWLFINVDKHIADTNYDKKKILMKKTSFINNNARKHHR